jgi:hypothetical protein
MPNSNIVRENDNVYLNVVIDHPIPIYNTGLVPPLIVNSFGVPAEYNVTKTLPIIDKASDFYCSIIRFDIPFNSIPLFIMPIVANQSNANLTPMVIGITYSSVNYPESVIYVPDNNFIAPVQNMQNQVISPYYYVYSYQNLITAFNVALAAAYVAAGSPGTVEPPYFFYNPVTQLINLVVNNAIILAGATIFMNVAANNYLDGFRTKTSITSTEGLTYSFILTDATPDQLALVPPYSAGDYIFSQQYNVINYWTSLRKILITSSTIPINYEFVPGYNSNGSQNGVSTSLPVITDFVPTLEYAGQSRSIGYYVPTSQYRLIDMIADTPIYKIDLKIYWEDKTGNLYPLLISIFQEANIKIAFLRKSLYKPMGLSLSK